MNKLIAEFLVPATTLAAAGSGSAQNDLMKSDTVILLVEYQLSDLGYDPGPIDGVFDDMAREAVLKFERDEGLVEDGYITDGLLNRLDELLAARKVDEDALAKRADAGPLWLVGIDPDGTTVRGVKRGSIADEYLRLKAGDAILTFDGKEVSDLDHLVELFSTAYNNLNVPVTLVVRRGETEIELSGELGHFYDDSGMREADQAPQQ
jgi:hypothetical protein